MRIRVSDSDTGLDTDRNTYAVRAGHEYEVPDEIPEGLAHAWINSGFASVVTEKRPSITEEEE